MKHTIHEGKNRSNKRYVHCTYCECGWIESLGLGYFPSCTMRNTLYIDNGQFFLLQCLGFIFTLGGLKP